MNNKYAIGTVIGAALLGLAKSSLLGSKNNGVVVRSIEELRRYANDPNLAPLVTRVDLEHKDLTTLPHEINNLTKLKTLELGYNSLDTLPLEICNLTNLEVLELRGNQFTTLPPEIGNLTNLKYLNLRGNPDLKITLNFVIDMLNTYQNTIVAELLTKYIHQQTIPAPQTIRMR